MIIVFGSINLITYWVNLNTYFRDHLNRFGIKLLHDTFIIRFFCPKILIIFSDLSHVVLLRRYTSLLGKNLRLRFWCSRWLLVLRLYHKINELTLPQCGVRIAWIILTFQFHKQTNSILYIHINVSTSKFWLAITK